MQTFSGLKLFPLDPRPEEISIEDIAHALSLKTRFNGQSRSFYSVGEHSVRCADYLWAKYRDFDLLRAGLFHDAAEYALPDVCRPIKADLINFQQIEDWLLEVICRKFNVAWPLPKEYKEADNALLMTEALALMEPKCLASWSNRYEPVSEELGKKMRYGGTITEPWDFQTAEKRFLLWAALTPAMAHYLHNIG